MAKHGFLGYHKSMGLSFQYKLAACLTSRVCRLQPSWKQCIYPQMAGKSYRKSYRSIEAAWKQLLVHCYRYFSGLSEGVDQPWLWGASIISIGSAGQKSRPEASRIHVFARKMAAFLKPKVNFSFCSWCRRLNTCTWAWAMGLSRWGK